MVDNDRSVIEVAFVDTPPSLFGPEPGTATDAAGSADERGRALEGRLVVVTGASGLLGAAFAAEVVERGARVCLIGRDMDALRATTATLGPDAPTAHLRCDLASAEDVEAGMRHAKRMIAERLGIDFISNYYRLTGFFIPGVSPELRMSVRGLLKVAYAGDQLKVEPIPVLVDASGGAAPASGGAG